MNLVSVDHGYCRGCGQPLTLREGQRQSRRYCADTCKMRFFRQQAQHQARPPAPAPMPWKGPVLHHGCFEDFAEAYRGQIDVILTDPPYDRTSLPVYAALATLARTVLVPGGYLLILTGKGLLPEIFAALTLPALEYITLIDYVFPGTLAQGFKWTATGKRVWMERAKPVLWYERRAPARPKGTRGRHPWKRFPGGTDRIEVEVQGPLDFDQERYPDQQSLTGFRSLVNLFTTPGDVILDPCMGWGTTLLAAVSVDRTRVIGIEQDGVRYGHARERLGLPPHHSERSKPCPED
jgi:DNA methylase